VNFSNAVARGLSNEKISAAELGYELSSGRITARLNGYCTFWKDKALLSRENIQLPDSTFTRSLVRGLNALHTGLEAEITALLFKNLSVAATASFGNWKWKNDVTASIYNDNQLLIDSVRIYTKGLVVGDAPQTQLGLSVDYSFLEKFMFTANWVYADKLYANFDPSNRSTSGDRKQPYRLPSYSIFDLYTSYDFHIHDFPATLLFSCQNVFNTVTMTRGDDGIDHSSNTVTGFWSQGRTFNISVKLSF
jgi:hypothetical protein